MACIVTGFPSHVAALQFEWAWQNTHLTRHIPAPQRITEARTSVRISPKSGRTRRRTARPRICVTDKISNLHLLLRVESFARWPLEVRFFCEDVHKVWQRWSERVDGKIRDGIRIVLDLEQSIESSEAVDTLLLPVSNQAQESQVGRSGRGGVKVVDVSYGALMPHAEKSKSLLTNDQTLYCSACGRTAEKECELVVTCPQSFCLGVSHMRCLANQFISAESPEDMIVPVEGNCPSCKSRVRWIDVVKELSLRAHGHAELTKLSKRPREAKHRVSKAKRAKKGPSNVMPESRVISEDEFTSDAPSEDMPEIPVPALHFYGRMHCEPEDNDDIVSISSLTSIDSQETLSIRIPRVSAASPSAIPKATIEDSDWDGAEVLD